MRSLTGKRHHHTAEFDTTKKLVVADSIVTPKSDSFVDAIVHKGKIEREERAKRIDSLQPVWRHRLEFKTFSGKIKARFEGPEEKQEFTAHIRIRKDSLIWIAITALGGMVPVARIYVTPDSFIFVNQRDNEYSRMSIAQASTLLPAPVSFYTMQNLLIGYPLQDGTLTDAKTEGEFWSLVIANDKYVQEMSYNRSDSTLHKGHVSTIAPNGPQMKMDYNGYVTTGNGRFSSNRTIAIHNGDKDFFLDMDYGKIDFDQQLEFSVSIPKSYTEKPFQVKPNK